MNTALQTLAPVAETAVVLRTELPWPERAQGLTIKDPETLQLAVDERGGAQELLKLAKSNHKTTCDLAYQTWQSTLEDRRKEVEPLEQAIATFDQKIIAWDRECKRVLADEQRRLEAAAYTVEVVEQEKVIEHVENTGGSRLEVESAIAKPVTIPVAPRAVQGPTAAAPAPVKPTGIQKVRENWKGEVTDVRAMVLFAVLGAKPPAEVQAWVDDHFRPELLSMLEQNQTACNKLADSTKGALVVPGVRFWDQGSVASSPKKVGA